jgi:hypothetical protein
MWTRRTFLQSAVSAPLAIALTPAVAASPLISFRVGPAHWLEDQPFHLLLNFLSEHEGIVNELSFFTSDTHPPLPLEVIEQRAERLAVILPKVRLAGMRAGINVLSTMGHHEENLENSLKARWQRVRDPFGNESRGSFCPAHPELQEYARQIYAALAKANPDFFWIDDDIRLLGHKPVTFTCFCDLCLRNFSAESGTSYTAETLVAAFDSGSTEDKIAIRRRWLEHNRGTTDQILRVVENAVHSVKPGLPLGFMTGDRFYEGYDFERWAKTLAGPGLAPVRWRPGGGFYSDETLLNLVDKAHAVGRQVASLPAFVVNIQSEVENFPYQPLRKSVKTTVTEASTYMAAGTTGTAFNVLSLMPGPLDEYKPLYERIAEFRPLYARMKSELGRSVVRGVWPAWNKDAFAALNLDGKWFSGGKLPFNDPYTLGEIGIPMAYSNAGASVTALTGAMVRLFSIEELREMFRGGVLMDVEAWIELRNLGLAKWTGLDEISVIEHDSFEVLSGDPVNGSFAGWSRDCRQSFSPNRAYSMRPVNGARILAGLKQYGGRDAGPCAIAYENDLGGRVVVMGYFPWSQFHDLGKATQMKSICQWLSRDGMPLRIDTFAKVAVWCRAGERGSQGIIILNTSLDSITELVISVPRQVASCAVVAADGIERRAALRSGPPGTNHSEIVIREVQPWSIPLLLLRT